MEGRKGWFKEKESDWSRRDELGGNVWTFVNKASWYALSTRCL